jgi:ubiquinone/menaquinone biosynthesis C-methylase UbiE
MIAKIFLSLTDYPAFRRIMWKPIYELMAKKIRVENWHFMNYGYSPFEQETPAILQPGDEINRYPIQLYHFLSTKVDLAGLEMLEVGSGRGGGAAYIKKYLGPMSLTGLDIAHNAVKLANKQHGMQGLQYVQGNAENLPFADKSFDVVINVESCHAYGSVPKFLSEVQRVLRPGGHFLVTDMRGPNGMDTQKKNLLNSGLDLLSEEDITMNVVEAIEKEELVKQERIAKGIPKWFQKAFKEFAGVKGSKIHEDLKSNALIYHRFVMRKKSQDMPEATEHVASSPHIK